MPQGREICDPWGGRVMTRTFTLSATVAPYASVSYRLSGRTFVGGHWCPSEAYFSRTLTAGNALEPIDIRAAGTLPNVPRN